MCFGFMAASVDSTREPEKGLVTILETWTGGRVPRVSRGSNPGEFDASYWESL